MKRNDLLWKAILEDIFDDFLLFFFPGNVHEFDFERGFEFLDKELEQIFPLPDNEQSPKFVDKLVKVYKKDGKEDWILVHVEVQGYTDDAFARRMFTYFYRILDSYNKPVTCIAILTDNKKAFKPREYYYNCLGTENNFKYNTYKVLEQNEDQLRGDSNPFAMAILTVYTALLKGRLADEDLLYLKIELYKTFIRAQLPRKKISALLYFLKNYVRFENNKINAKFEHEIDIINDKSSVMGIEQYLIQEAKKEVTQEVVTERNTAFVKALLNETDFDTEKIATLVGVPVTFVEAIKASLSK